jgi:CelD/BcsL family acetyltransferase involved in cellulose biosynthesis
VTNICAVLIDDVVKLAAIESSWQELWRRVPTATPFQSPAWLLPWWRSFSPGELAVVAAWRGGGLVGLLPLYRARAAGEDRILPLGVGVSDYIDMLLDPRCGPISIDTLLEPLFQLPWRSHICIVEDIPPWSTALALDPPRRWSHSVEPQNACPVLNLSDGIPVGMQRRLRRGARRAERLGGLDIRSIDGGKIDEFLDVLFLLHGVRWRSRDAQPGVLSDAAVRAFHRNALPRLGRTGIARLYELRIGGSIAGCYYGFFDRGRAYAYIGGFDPCYATVSPGALLLAHAIEAAQREGGAEFHFLRGREAYKYEWGAVDHWNRRLCFQSVPTHVDRSA